MHYLMLRVTFENCQYGHRLISRGSRKHCEDQAWHTNVEGFRGPGIVKAELILVTPEAWRKILALQCRRRG